LLARRLTFVLFRLLLATLASDILLELFGFLAHLELLISHFIERLQAFASVLLGVADDVRLFLDQSIESLQLLVEFFQRIVFVGNLFSLLSLLLLLLL
jgi:hypothetical protein